MKMQDLAGSWSLEAFEVEDSGGSVSAWGRNATGILIYSPDGRMSVAINADPDGDPAYPGVLLDAMLFYSGTYELRGGQIVHHVKNASDRNRIGQDMVRDAKIEGGLLSITATGSYGTSRLRWRRNV